MNRRHDGGPGSADSIGIRPERRRGLADQIATARARRNAAKLGVEDFQRDPAAPTSEPRERSHDDLRAELRRIIAEDAERAANEPGAPAIEETAAPMETKVSPRRHSRIKIAAYWLGCFLGIGAVAYGLTRPT